MQKDDLLATKVIMAANIFLISSKALVAFLTGSIGVVAVLADSCFDFLGGLFAYAGVKKGREPADFDHHFGHRKYEAVASIAQMGLVALAAAFIAIEAVRRLLDGAVLEISGADLAIMGITIGVDALLVAYLSKFANCKNPAIAASIGNYKSDILQNSLVLVGLFASSSGFSAADPIVALIVSMLMMRIALRVSNEAMGDITDQSPPAEKLEEYGKEIMKVRGVRSFHRLRARKSSGKVHLDVHLQFHPKRSITSAHHISRRVKNRLLGKFPELSEVLIHAEPDDKWQRNAPKFGS